MGLFIVLEGIDGSGKTTQALLLSHWLIEKGYKVLLTEEPTRELLTGYFVKIALRHKDRLPPESYLLLFLADRLNHIRNRILPALRDGRIVISDRYHFSTLAYQTAQGIPREKIEAIVKALGMEIPLPHITFYIDIPVDVALERLGERERGMIDLFEKREFLERVRRNFLALADEFGFTIIDGTREPLEIHREITEKLEGALPGQNG